MTFKFICVILSIEIKERNELYSTKVQKAGNKMATKKIDMERIQEALNDRYSFIQQDERPADKVYYEGMLNLLN